MLILAAVIFYCPDLHCTKFHFTASAVYFEESTSLQCFALYGTYCTTLLEFKAIVKFANKYAVHYRAFHYNVIMQ